MKPEYFEPKDEVDKIVDTLIKLPIKNLENRVKEFEKEIKTRQKILDSSLSSLRNREFELENQVWRMRYCLGSELNRKFMLENELSKIKTSKINDLISNFRDVSRLKERLLSAKEELAIEKEKRKLVV